jgi:hypothetical protein
VEYSNEEADGGLQIIGFEESIGFQYYSGSEAAPIFSPGRFLTQTGVVTIAAAPTVPEPSTWAMALIGFASLGCLAFRRKGAPGPHACGCTKTERRG